MAKTALAAAYRMSQADMMSMESPMATPCAAAMTGHGQRSRAEIEDWNAAMNGRSWSARREGSSSPTACGSAETGFVRVS